VFLFVHHQIHDPLHSHPQARTPILQTHIRNSSDSFPHLDSLGLLPITPALLLLSRPRRSKTHQLPSNPLFYKRSDRLSTPRKDFRSTTHTQDPVKLVGSALLRCRYPSADLTTGFAIQSALPKTFLLSTQPRRIPPTSRIDPMCPDQRMFLAQVNTANPNPDIVPNDMWVCCQCHQGNLIVYGNVCPAPCGHTRDNYCKGPGQQRPSPDPFFSEISYPHSESHNTGAAYQGPAPPLAIPTPLYTSSDPPRDVWKCNECGADNCNWLEFCPICGAYGSMVSKCMNGSGDFNSSSPTDAPPDDYWACECGASNSGLTPDFCPLCGRTR
jgi:hypothetical protein